MSQERTLELIDELARIKKPLHHFGMAQGSTISVLVMGLPKLFEWLRDKTNPKKVNRENIFVLPNGIEVLQVSPEPDSALGRNVVLAVVHFSRFAELEDSLMRRMRARFGYREPFPQVLVAAD